MNNRTIKTIDPLLLAALGVTVVIHIGSLTNFLVADSWVFMVRHSFLDNFSYFFRTMLPPEHNALWLRPIPMFFFWIDSILWPLSNWGPHLVNIVFHVVNTWLVYRITRLITGGYESAETVSLPGFCAALCYGVHPLTVGSVAWVAARFDVMAVTFGLAGLYFWVWRDRGETGWITAAAAFVGFFACIFSKEQGVVFLAAAIVLSAMRVFDGGERRKEGIRDILVVAGLLTVYVVWRFAAFKGWGGYLEARHGLSLKPPAYFATALIWPWSNLFPGWIFSARMVAAAIILVAAVWYSLRRFRISFGSFPGACFVMAAALCVFSLATTAPNPGMTFGRIMGHAESRFALQAIAGLALMAGIATDRFSRSLTAARAVIVITVVLGIAGAWRTDIQNQAWCNASATARTIVETTIVEVPNPNPAATFIFLDIPLTNEQWAYVFGIGLEEALNLRYPGRYDLRFLRYPTREEFRRARPDRDYVFKYYPDRKTLDRLQAVEQNDMQQ